MPTKREVVFMTTIVRKIVSKQFGSKYGMLCSRITPDLCRRSIGQLTPSQKLIKVKTGRSRQMTVKCEKPLQNTGPSNDQSILEQCCTEATIPCSLSSFAKRLLGLYTFGHIHWCLSFDFEAWSVCDVFGTIRQGL